MFYVLNSDTSLGALLGSKKQKHEALSTGIGDQHFLAVAVMYDSYSGCPFAVPLTLPIVAILKPTSPKGPE